MPHTSPPATKADIRLLMEQMGSLYRKMEVRFADVFEHVDKKIAASEERTKRHFDVVAENMRHDYLGAYKDRIENLDIRVQRLEHHTGLVR